MQRKKTIGQILQYVGLSLAVTPSLLSAQSITLSQVTEADTYVSSGQPTINFGTMGAMEIAAPTTAQNRTEETLLRFNTSAIAAGFNSDFGAGNWTVTSVTLSLFSNVATAGQQAANASFNKIAAGDFEFDLLSDNNWSETAITWNSLPAILPGSGNNTLTQLGTYSWAATGASSSTWTLNTDPNLVGDIATGTDVTIFGQPTADSTVGYLYNTLLNNPGYLNVTATVVPEPASMLLMVSSGIAFLALRRRA